MPYFSTAQFIRAHGKRPGGLGNWAFYIDRSPEPVWFKNMLFSEAKAAVIAAATTQGASFIEVGS